jgi:hypothetical protein
MDFNGCDGFDGWNKNTKTAFIKSVAILALLFFLAIVQHRYL